MDVQAYGVLLLAILIGVTGQLLLKYGMSRQPGFGLADLVVLWRNLPVLSGFVCYGLSTLLYLGVLARLELSLAYPTVSLGYVLAIIMSRLIFQETVPLRRWFAAAMICGGVALVGLGSA